MPEAAGTATSHFKYCADGTANAYCRNYIDVPATISAYRPVWCRNVQHNAFTRLFYNAPSDPFTQQEVVQFNCSRLSV